MARFMALPGVQNVHTHLNTSVLLHFQCRNSSHYSVLTLRLAAYDPSKLTGMNRYNAVCCSIISEYRIESTEFVKIVYKGS
jgi:hypothetical protein